jgi:hypothetical protein
MLVYYTGYGQWIQKFKAFKNQKAGSVDLSEIILVNGLFKLTEKDTRELKYRKKVSVKTLMPCFSDKDCASIANNNDFFYEEVCNTYHQSPPFSFHVCIYNKIKYYIDTQNDITFTLFNVEENTLNHLDPYYEYRWEKYYESEVVSRKKTITNKIVSIKKTVINKIETNEKSIPKKRIAFIIKQLELLENKNRLEGKLFNKLCLPLTKKSLYEWLKNIDKSEKTCLFIELSTNAKEKDQFNVILNFESFKNEWQKINKLGYGCYGKSNKKCMKLDHEQYQKSIQS